MKYRVYGQTALRGWELVSDKLTTEDEIMGLVATAKDNINYVKVMVIRDDGYGDECIISEDSNHRFKDIHTDKKSKRKIKNIKCEVKNKRF